jgi:hypothetical protein
MQVVVDYIKMRPDRKSADFSLVADQAMEKAWPCKKIAREQASDMHASHHAPTEAI